jgi:hypothetical protein
VDRTCSLHGDHETCTEFWKSLRKDSTGGTESYDEEIILKLISEKYAVKMLTESSRSRVEPKDKSGDQENVHSNSVTRHYLKI